MIYFFRNNFIVIYFSVIVVGCELWSPTERTRVIVDLDCMLGCGAKVPSLLVLVINA